ncbi:AraC family transcriptional regulator [Noviherbaspirillum aerium]|uniref:AraC family transcriptional regulator n=1 Tax=Noviherbaspirillum aerium TaxID=2588497 RepID=UPI00124EE390|nr:AraC family transcriptional regulator [Noviherbaspirillum aerium]
MDLQAPIDRLSALLTRFRVRVSLFHSGPLCGLQKFDCGSGLGFLHVLRRGRMEVTHHGTAGMPEKLVLDEPSLLFYPRPLTHHFHNPPRDGSDFTCAALEFEGGENNLLARSLPPFLRLRLDAVEGLEPALALLFAETDRVRCGQRVLADRLFEVVLIQLLRWLLDHPEQAGIQPGLITGLSHPRLARALVALHEAPGDAWTLERLAECAGMSRTSFATVFKQVVGQTPADHVASCRIALAQAGLREGRPVKLLAEQLGYANPPALSRAFAAKVGLSPRDWLTRDRGAGEAQAGSDTVPQNLP